MQSQGHVTYRGVWLKQCLVVHFPIGTGSLENKSCSRSIRGTLLKHFAVSLEGGATKPQGSPTSCGTLVNKDERGRPLSYDIGPLVARDYSTFQDNVRRSVFSCICRVDGCPAVGVSGHGSGDAVAQVSQATLMWNRPALRHATKRLSAGGCCQLPC